MCFSPLYPGSPLTGTSTHSEYPGEMQHNVNDFIGKIENVGGAYCFAEGF